MKRLFLLFALVCVSAASVQAGEPADSLVVPKFQGGGQIAFTRWVLQNLKFPAIYYESDTEVRASVSFVITKKGVVKSVRVFDGVEKPYADEIVRVVSSSPNWSPQLRNGKPVDWEGVILLNFRLRKATGDDGVEKFTTEDDTAYRAADPMPTFNGGGPKEFRAWVLSMLDGVQIDTTLRIRVGGIVERDGRMTKLKVGVSRGEDRLLRDVIERRLTETPVWWAPGVLQGDTVRVQLMVEMSADPGSDDADFVFGDRFEICGADDASEDVEQMPTFQGGDLSVFRQWVMQNLLFPQTLLEAGIQGRVVVSFVIDCDGILGLVRILQSPAPELSAEVVRALTRSPRWRPGWQDGKTVRVKYTLPIDFIAQR